MIGKFTDAAKFFKGLNGQINAFEYLQENTPLEIQEKFFELYRENITVNIIDKKQLSLIWNRSPVVIGDDIIKDLNDCLYKFDITTLARVRHFIAQCSHESGAGKWFREIASGWAYEGRKDLGNIRNGDGPRFKGAGFIQLTGRYNYQKFADYIKDSNVMNGVDYVSTKYPFTSSGFWWKLNNMNRLCDSGASVAIISQKVNGRHPANGLSDREYYYKRCVQYIKNV